jgi:Arc/MetJ family transcription regulator
MRNQGVTMRTTLAIDDDVLAAAKTMAEQQRRSVGDVISDLARRSLNRPQALKERNGIPLLTPKPGNPPVTLDLVNKLRDELP